MSDNTKQFRWIVLLKESLECWFFIVFYWVLVIAEVGPILLWGHFVNGDLSLEGLRRVAGTVVGQ